MAKSEVRPGVVERIASALAEAVRRVLERGWTPAAVPARAGTSRGGTARRAAANAARTGA